MKSQHQLQLKSRMRGITPRFIPAYGSECKVSSLPMLKCVCNTVEILINSLRFSQMLSEVFFHLYHIFLPLLSHTTNTAHEEYPYTNKQKHWPPTYQYVPKYLHDLSIKN